MLVLLATTREGDCILQLPVAAELRARIGSAARQPRFVFTLKSLGHESLTSYTSCDNQGIRSVLTRHNQGRNVSTRRAGRAVRNNHVSKGQLVAFRRDAVPVVARRTASAGRTSQHRSGGNYIEAGRAATVHKGLAAVAGLPTRQGNGNLV